MLAACCIRYSLGSCVARGFHLPSGRNKDQAQLSLFLGEDALPAKLLYKRRASPLSRQTLCSLFLPERVSFFFFFNFSLNKRQTKHKSKSLRAATIHKPPHILYLLKSLGSTYPFHSWAGQAVVVQLPQQVGYWIHGWWVSMKWKPLSACPGDSSGVPVCRGTCLEKRMGLFFSVSPPSPNTNAPSSLTGAPRIHTRVLEIGMYPKTVPSPGNSPICTLDIIARAGSRGRWTALAPSCGDRHQSELTAKISGTQRYCSRGISPGNPYKDHLRASMD